MECSGETTGNVYDIMYIARGKSHYFGFQHYIIIH